MLPVGCENFTAELPLEHCQTGLPLGNGSLGLSVWGGNGIVNITVGSTALPDGGCMNSAPQCGIRREYFCNRGACSNFPTRN